MSTLQIFLAGAAVIPLAVLAVYLFLGVADIPLTQAQDAGRRARICRSCGYNFHSRLSCPKCNVIQTTNLNVERTIRHRSLCENDFGRVTSVCRIPDGVGDEIMSVVPKGGYLLLNAKADGEDVTVLGQIIYAERRAEYVYITHDIPNVVSWGDLPKRVLKAQETVPAVIQLPVIVDGVM